MIKKIIVLVTILVSINSFAQENSISPYSFFGIGQVNEAQTVSEHTTGVGTALNSPFKLHFSNPASLAALRFTTYTLAAKNVYTKVDDGTNQQATSAFGLSYLAVGFPVGKKAGFAFGLQPFSKVGYSILNSYKNTDDETETNLYKGQGRTNRVFLGFGQKLPYNISLGLETSYVFGNLDRTILWRNTNRLDQLASYYQTDTQVSGWAFKFGAQHQYKINDKLVLKSGLSFLLENKLTYKGDETLKSILNTTNPDLISPRDEVYNRAYEGNVTMPLKTNLGIGVGADNKWFAGFEYEFQDATTYSANFIQNNNFVKYVKASNMAFGGFYIPKATSITNYWSRVTYSAGVHLKQTGLEINNTAIKDFGISFGVTLPSKRKLSNVNLGFDIGKRGEIKNNGLIKENYYNFRLSLSFNDKWFRKRKLD